MRVNFYLLPTTAAITLVCLPLAAFGTTLFFVFYFLAYAGVTAFGNCVPVLVFQRLPKDVIGKYTAWRMLLFTLGNAIPGFFMNTLLDTFGAAPVLLLGGLCVAACAVGYLLVLGREKNL